MIPPETLYVIPGLAATLLKVGDIKIVLEIRKEAKHLEKIENYKLSSYPTILLQ